ncbi:MAG: hypothetical protein Q7S09_00190 [bacterium]|nr:hypothetical protein [bacterium]
MRALWKYNRKTTLPWGAACFFRIEKGKESEVLHVFEIQHCAALEYHSGGVISTPNVVPVVSCNTCNQFHHGIEVRRIARPDINVTRISVQDPLKGDTLLIEVPNQSGGVLGAIFVYTGWRWKALKSLDNFHNSWGIRGFRLYLYPDSKSASRLELWKYDSGLRWPGFKEEELNTEFSELREHRVPRGKILNFVGGGESLESLEDSAMHLVNEKFRKLNVRFYEFRRAGINFSDAIYASRSFSRSSKVEVVRKIFEREGLGMERAARGGALVPLAKKDAVNEENPQNHFIRYW